MAGFDHNAESIADNYARTLLELSEEAQRSEAILSEFQDFVSLMEKDAAFGNFMVNPAVDADDRRELLEKHFRGKMDNLLLSALQVVNRRNRCELAPLICERYRLALEEARGEVDVYVTTAVELTSSLRDQITQAATAVAGKKARLIEQVDPDILGGLVVRIEDEKLDSSVARQLNRLHDMLAKRASQELHGDRSFVEMA